MRFLKWISSVACFSSKFSPQQAKKVKTKRFYTPTFGEKKTTRFVSPKKIFWKVSEARGKEGGRWRVGSRVRVLLLESVDNCSGAEQLLSLHPWLTSLHPWLTTRFTPPVTDDALFFFPQVSTVETEFQLSFNWVSTDAKLTITVFSVYGHLRDFFGIFKVFVEKW